MNIIYLKLISGNAAATSNSYIIRNTQGYFLITLHITALKENSQCMSGEIYVLKLF